MRVRAVFSFVILMVGTFLLPIQKAVSQQITPNLINLDLIGYNPAITGSQNGGGVLLVNHQDFQFQYRLTQASIFMPTLKIGAGLLVESYQSLLQSQTQFRFNLSRQIKTKSGFFQFGLAPAIQNSRLSSDNLKIKNPEDPSSSFGNNNFWGVNYNVGTLYKSKRFLASLWVQNLATHASFTKNENLSISLQRQISGFSSYKFPMGQHWQYVPSIYYQNLQGTSFAAFANQLIFKSVFIAFQFGSYRTWTSSLGIYRSEIGKFGNLYLGYSLSSKSLGISTILAHEVYLNFAFGNRHKPKAKIDNIPYYHSPVYF